MRKSLQVILFLRTFIMGTMVPVFILVLTTHGATLETSSLFKGVASFVIIAAEFPSGVFADLFGRKLSFTVSMILQLAGFLLLYLAQSPAMLAGAMVVYGLSRAFASGSLEALALDETGDPDKLVSVTTRLGVLESAGLAGGSLLGGLLAEIGTRYAANILLNVGGAAVILGLTLFTVRESEHIRNTDRENRPSLKAHLHKSFSFVSQSSMVRMLFILCFLTGIAVATVETYWQPTLQSFTPAKWVFGLVGFLGFGCVMLGSKAAEWILIKRPRGGVAFFLISKAVMSLLLALFIAAVTKFSFIAVYMLWYMFLGSNAVAEQTLLNREAPPAQRASILSLLSFDWQLGSLAASLFCYLIASAMDFRYTWLIAACLLAAATAVFAVPFLRRGARKDGLQ
jgi:MFS family permease